MSIFSLIYVSRCGLSDEEAIEAIDDIVATAVERNGREGITGALLCTGANFVQILEGHEPAVRVLMNDIERDRRHDQVDVVETTYGPERMFGGWSMAYIGDAIFARSAVSDLLGVNPSVGRSDAVGYIRRLMREFVHGSQ